MNDIMIDLDLRRWTERYEQHLDQVPQLLEVMRVQANPLKAARMDTERVSGGGGEAPLPFRLDPVDDCDDLWAALVEYVGEVAERLQHPAPGATGASWGAQGNVRGIGAGVSGDRAYKAGFALIGWLIDRARFTYDLQLKDSEQHLFALIRKLQGRYVVPPIERPSRRRLCSVCGEYAVVTAWVLGEAGEAECRVCGAVYAAEGMENHG